jgi:hypothetical protein
MVKRKSDKQKAKLLVKTGIILYIFVIFFTCHIVKIDVSDKYYCARDEYTLTAEESSVTFAQIAEKSRSRRFLQRDTACMQSIRIRRYAIADILKPR